MELTPNSDLGSVRVCRHNPFVYNLLLGVLRYSRFFVSLSTSNNGAVRKSATGITCNRVTATRQHSTARSKFSMGMRSQ